MFMYRQLVLYLVWYSWLLLPVGLAPWRVAAAMESGGWQRCWATWSCRNDGGQQGTHTGPSDAHSCYRQSAIASLPPPPHHDAAHTGHALLSTVTRGYNFLHSKVRHKVQRKTIREVQKAAAWAGLGSSSGWLSLPPTRPHNRYQAFLSYRPICTKSKNNHVFCLFTLSQN